MFVRMKTGRYAGEVREVEFTVGRDLVSLGRAERIDFSGAVQYPPAPPEIAASNPLDDSNDRKRPASPLRTETSRSEQPRRSNRSKR